MLTGTLRMKSRNGKSQAMYVIIWGRFRATTVTEEEQ